MKFNMDFQDKTKEELLTHLLELQQKCEVLAASYEKDITELKLESDAILDNESIYKAIVESSGDLIFCADRDGRFKFVNSAFASGFGKPVVDFSEMTFWDVFPKEITSQLHEEMLKVFETGEPTSSEVMIPLQEKQIHCLTKMVPLKGNDGFGYLIATCTDITERKLNEEVLRESEIRLSKLNATKDKFFSIIAHDLKSPFNAILGFSNLMINQLREKDFDGVEKYADIIQQASMRAIDLLMNLMEWSRSQTGRMEFNPELIDIGKLTRYIIELLIDSADQKSISIKLKIAPNVSVVADKAMLSTVLRNIISNGIKFTNQGGEISISSERRQNEMIVSVKDNGVGIDDKDKGKLFRIDQIYSRSGTLKEKGTGLGLILCKDFIEKHGGKIWFESEKGVGSTFYFSIPIV